MKAERRHELQENTLAHVLSNFPLYLSVYAGRIVTVVLVVALVFLLFRYRAAAKQQQFETTRINLAQAREATFQLGQLVGGLREPTQTAQLRSQLLLDANAAIDAVLANADTDTIKAEALVSRGDLYWTAANLPDLSGAATQPALALPEPRDELLAKAAGAYEQVLSQHPKQSLAVASALMGLAAIAENRGQFDEALKRYEQMKTADIPQLFKALAEGRIAQMPLIRVQRRIVAATMPALDLPATAPGANGATTLPAGVAAPDSAPPPAAVETPATESPATEIPATQPG